MSFALAIAGLLLFDTLAMGSLKKFTLNNNYALLGLAFALEAIAWIFLIWGTKIKGLVLTNSLWDILSFISIALVGIFLFKEKLVVRHWVGLVTGFVAIALLAF